MNSSCEVFGSEVEEAYRVCASRLSTHCYTLATLEAAVSKRRNSGSTISSAGQRGQCGASWMMASEKDKTRRFGSCETRHCELPAKPALSRLGSSSLEPSPFVHPDHQPQLQPHPFPQTPRLSPKSHLSDISDLGPVPQTCSLLFSPNP